MRIFTIMKTLPLLLLGAGALYFVAKKPAKVSKTNISDPSNIVSSKGYEITNCSLKVYDLQKSLDYAYEAGVKYGSKGPDYVINFIFGLCLTKDKLWLLVDGDQNDKFIFEMVKYGLSGLYSKTLETDPVKKKDLRLGLLAILIDLRIKLIESGSDESSFYIDLL
jgi:hypothetical protein